MKKTVKLSGRIDTTNVSEIEKNLFEEIKDFKGELIIDASELEYISSAGLRMILKIKKGNDQTKIINCNLEVYGIFEMTGFTDMMSISKAFRKLSIDGCEKIGDGFYGTVYRMDPETIVKVYKKPDCLDVIESERALARKAFVLGIPTAMSYDIVRVGDQYGAVFELLDCKSLERLIQEGESIHDLGVACVDILKKMHSIVLKKGELPYRKEFILETAESCKSYLPDKVYKKLISFIKHIKETNTMLHGDFHIKNLMKQEDGIVIIDMDCLSLGNPIFEFGAMYATYVGFACVDSDNPKRFLGITVEQSSQMWDTLFNTYYADKTDEEKEDLMNQIMILGYLEVLYLRTKFNDLKNKIQQKEIAFCIDYLTDHISSVEK